MYYLCGPVTNDPVVGDHCFKTLAFKNPWKLFHPQRVIQKQMVGITSRHSERTLLETIFL